MIHFEMLTVNKKTKWRPDSSGLNYQFLIPTPQKMHIRSILLNNFTEKSFKYILYFS